MLHQITDIQSIHEFHKTVQHIISKFVDVIDKDEFDISVYSYVVDEQDFTSFEIAGFIEDDLRGKLTTHVEEKFGLILHHP